MDKKGLLKIVLIFHIVILFLSANAIAHKSNIHVEFEDGKVKVRCYFSTNDPMKNSKITVTDEKEKVIARGKTNGEGKFDFHLPDGVKEVKIVVTDVLGHLGEMEITRERLTHIHD